MAKRRIAILGGGISAMTSAFWLTSYPGWKDDWEIDVYQLGWRLGGKGASGRNPERRHRIEEHGLHLLLGFYDNAFVTLRKLYAELGRGPQEPLATLEQAFKRRGHVVFMEPRPGDRWEPWSIQFPQRDGMPGTGEAPSGGWDYVRRLLDWMVTWLSAAGLLPVLSLDHVEQVVAGVHRASEDRPGAGGAIGLHGLLVDVAKGLAGRVAGGLSALAGMTDLDNQLIYAAIRLAGDVGSATHPESRHGAVAHLVGRFRDWVWRQVEPILDRNADARRAFIMIDLTAAIIDGMVADDLVGADPYWFKIDDQEFRGWLKAHGASQLTVECAPLTAAYALPFAEQTGIAAGTGLSGLLRMMLGYKGAMFWEMQAGMGDTIFTPFYEVLRRRGVRFHFFHRVDRLELAADRATVARIHIGRQVTVARGSYDPLVEVKGLPAWPSRPRFEQLVEGEALAAAGADLEDWWTDWTDRGTPLVLEHGADFDHVILGTAVATFPYIAQEVLDAVPAFAAMTSKLVTTQTQALQLWFRPDLRGLGWVYADRPPPVVGGYALWMDTWADMTHLLPREDWPAGKEPGNLAYLCCRLLDDEPLPPRSDHGYTARQAARVRANAVDWLTHHVAPLWPAAVDANDPKALNWWFLVDPEERDGAARLDGQFWRATVNPSERYVLSLPGTTAFRLRAEDTGLTNLLHVGDHTFTGVNAGCVEAAVMSGMNAAQHLCRHPAVILGDVLPRRGPWGAR